MARQLLATRIVRLSLGAFAILLPFVLCGCRALSLLRPSILEQLTPPAVSGAFGR